MILAALFAGAADDPGGWSKARWGMTDAQLSDAFGTDSLHLDGHFSVNLTVAKIPCHAMMDLDKDGHLTVVGIEPVKTTDMTDVLYLSLQDMLVQKYGRPWKSSEENGITNLQWTFPTTLITLQRMKFDFPEIGMRVEQRIVSLTYKRITPESNPL